MINHMDSLKKAMSVSVNQRISDTWVGIKGFIDAPATTVIVLVEIFSSCPRT